MKLTTKIISPASLLCTLFLSTLFLSTLACAPRGENKSIDEVLQLQQSNFTSRVQSTSINESAASQLKALTASLQQLQATSDVAAISATSSGVSEALTVLTAKAGYTSRASLTELINQYRVISQDASGVNASAVKLLVARTYSALASELETTKFNL